MTSSLVNKQIQINESKKKSAEAERRSLNELLSAQAFTFESLEADDGSVTKRNESPQFSKDTPDEALYNEEMGLIYSLTQVSFRYKLKCRCIIIFIRITH